MNNELVQYLLNYAYDHGIGYKIEAVDPDWIPVYIPWKNLIIINSNWRDPKQIALQVAHEIGHALNDDSEFEYQACFSATSKVERAATRRGLEIIIKHVYDDSELYDVNYRQFMDVLSVPGHYEGDVKSLITDYFKNR